MPQEILKITPSEIESDGILSILSPFDVPVDTSTQNFLKCVICMPIRGEAIMLVKLSIILFSNSHNFTYYAHRFYLLFSKLCFI